MSRGDGTDEEKRAGRTSRRLPGRLVTAGLFVVAAACAPNADDEVATGADTASVPEAAAAGEDAADAYIRPSSTDTELTSGDTISGFPSWTEQDWGVLRERARWAWGSGVDTLPIGERVAAVGRRFVGQPYVPQTLDPPGPEGLVVNLRALDCVTFVENMLALSYFLESAEPSILEDRSRALELYSEILTSIRYRNGEMDGYPSRLHYFSEWIFDNEQKGYVEDVTRSLGGVADDEDIFFMTEHRDAYRQLTRLEDFQAIERIEERLSERIRHYIPQERVAELQDGIRTGDIIAATSTLDGLDVAHTGIALWDGGTLRLMHAPLVGEDVQISERPLAERLLDISGQDGLMVARPRPAPAGRF